MAGFFKNMGVGIGKEKDAIINWFVNNTNAGADQIFVLDDLSVNINIYGLMVNNERGAEMLMDIPYKINACSSIILTGNITLSNLPNQCGSLSIIDNKFITNLQGIPSVINNLTVKQCDNLISMEGVGDVCNISIMYCKNIKECMFPDSCVNIDIRGENKLHIPEKYYDRMCIRKMDENSGHPWVNTEPSGYTSHTEGYHPAVWADATTGKTISSIF